MEFKILQLQEHPEWIESASAWFSQKWEIPQEAYAESMRESLVTTPIPSWFIAVEQNCILGGVGVIENDFHKRKDCTPNICALYVEEKARHQGLARQLLDTASQGMKQRGITTLYLITDHTEFYEKVGWDYFGEVESDEGEMMRMYIHRETQ